MLNVSSCGWPSSHVACRMLAFAQCTQHSHTSHAAAALRRVGHQSGSLHRSNARRPCAAAGRAREVRCGARAHRRAPRNDPPGMAVPPKCRSHRAADASSCTRALVHACAWAHTHPRTQWIGDAEACGASRGDSGIANKASWHDVFRRCSRSSLMRRMWSSAGSSVTSPSSRRLRPSAALPTRSSRRSSSRRQSARRRHSSAVYCSHPFPLRTAGPSILPRQA